jgi:hypothetical protein
LASELSEDMDIDSPAQTVTYIGRVPRPSGRWWAAATTNTDTPMPDFNNSVMDHDEDVVNISRNFIDHEEQKLFDKR